jgi:hypothetical protein
MGQVEPTLAIQALIVLPQQVILLPGTDTAFQAFMASATDTLPVAAEWTATGGGTITPDGRYTAAQVTGSDYTVSAQVRDQVDTAFVAVSATPLIRMEIRPDSVVVTAGQKFTFQAVAIDADSQEVPVSAAWSAAGGSMNPITGEWTPPAASGRYEIYAATGQFSDTAIGRVDTIPGPPPPVVGEPALLPTDSLVYRENFEGYANSTALISAYPANRENRGTINLDQNVAFEGQRAFRIDWEYNGCLSGTDSDVLIERGTPVGGGQRDWYVSYYARWTEGYLFAWPSGSGCGGNSSKEMAIFRGSGLPRITWAATVEPACPEIYGRINSLRWTFAIGAEPGSTQPSCGSNYRQYLALGSKDPASLGDGQWHRITFRYLKESAIDVGDGIVQVWIDGVQIMDYDGTDIDNPAYGQVYTRTTGMFRPLQYQSVIVRGAAQVQSRWYDDVKIWYRP